MNGHTDATRIKDIQRFKFDRPIAAGNLLRRSSAGGDFTRKDANACDHACFLFISTISTAVIVAGILCVLALVKTQISVVAIAKMD